MCAIGQLLIDKTKLTPARILTAYVVAGVILGAVGLYQPLADWAGAGASVPLTGFGHTLAKGMTDAVIDTRSGYNYPFHDNGLFVNIDHILVDKHFTPLTADILHVDYSDHYPVVATFAKRK